MHHSIHTSLAILALTALCPAQEPNAKPAGSTAPVSDSLKVEAPVYKWSAPAQEALDASNRAGKLMKQCSESIKSAQAPIKQ